MASLNRRQEYRVPMQIFLNQYIADNPYRCMSLNLSSKGFFLNRLITPPLAKRPRIVGLEFELPGTSELVWARGEIRYDQKDTFFHGTGVEITGIPQKHARLLHDYVLEQRHQKLKAILSTIRRNRLCA